MSQSSMPPSGPPATNLEKAEQPEEAQQAENPYADQQPGTGTPTAPQSEVPQQGFPTAPGYPVAPAPPAAPARTNVVLGLAAAVGAALVAAGVYGAIIGATRHEIGWAAVGVGFLIGLAAGRVGGRSPVLPIVSVVLSVGSVYLGQLIGEAMIGAKDNGVGFNEVFFQHFDWVQEAWKAEADPLTFVFFAIAAYVAFSSTQKAGR
ncbi:hypothetical protein [Streptomyces sp. NPDC058371]|uniref:hypothetical protein n=1 Tax=Streptomyces sp. NPDC058371 TaxID=3346463 RepID=UPI0036621C1F